MPGTTPIVSVTICCYNSEQYIAETLQSVLNQTFDHFEIVVVNDGSTDRTEEIVKSFSDPRIKYHFQANAGVGATRNRAVDLSRGKYVAFLDHDDLWEPTKLEKQIPLFETQPEVALVYSDCYFIDPNGERFATYFAYQGVEPCRGDALLALIKHGCFMQLPSVIVSKEALVEVGKFDPRYNIVEDYDTWMKIADRHAVDYVGEPLCSYRVHSANTSRIQQERGYQEVLNLVTEWMGRRDLAPEVREELDRQYAQYAVSYLYWLLSRGKLAAASARSIRFTLSESKHLFAVWKPDWNPKGSWRRASQAVRVIKSEVRKRWMGRDRGL
jgi:cellulose synthase/poly-beta-1,6-N-acetylglucosamine synthase-like glycosyltransferase